MRNLTAKTRRHKEEGITAKDAEDAKSGQHGEDTGTNEVRRQKQECRRQKYGPNWLSFLYVLPGFGPEIL